MSEGHSAVGHRLLHVHGLAAPRTRLTLTDNHRRADDALHLDPTRLGPCARPLADGRERFERDGTVFFYPVGLQNLLDLGFADIHPACAKMLGNRARMVLGMVDECHQDVHDPRQIERRWAWCRHARRGGHLPGFSPLSQLRTSPLRIRIDVNVCPFHAFAAHLICRNEAAKRVVDPQAHNHLKLLVRVARHGVSNQDDERGTQRPVPRKTHLADEPQAVRVKQGDRLECVEPAGMAVARPIADAAQGSEDGDPRRRAQATLQVFELHDRPMAKERLNGCRGIAVLPVRHGSSPELCNNYDLSLARSRNCCKTGRSHPCGCARGP